jgi:hypothetical protein
LNEKKRTEKPRRQGHAGANPMKPMIEKAIQSAADVKQQIEKIRKNFHYPQKEYIMADDAVLGSGWAIKRLKDLEAAINAKPSP